MANFNKSQIMKQAWNITKKAGCSFSTALKNAWKIAKFENEMFAKYYVAKNEGTMTFKIWANYGKVRAYYTCSWRSNYQNSKNSNFVELAA